jgi:hypothetical protein
MSALRAIGDWGEQCVQRYYEERLRTGYWTAHLANDDCRTHDIECRQVDEFGKTIETHFLECKATLDKNSHGIPYPRLKKYVEFWSCSSFADCFWIVRVSLPLRQMLFFPLYNLERSLEETENRATAQGKDLSHVWAQLEPHLAAKRIPLTDEDRRRGNDLFLRIGSPADGDLFGHN